MAKDDRQVHSGVWVDGKLYTDADELEKVASAEQLTYLSERGAISGTFKAGAGSNAGLSKMKVDELRALAEEKGVEGAADMKKAELLAALEGE